MINRFLKGLTGDMPAECIDTFQPIHNPIVYTQATLQRTQASFVTHLQNLKQEKASSKVWI